MAAHRIAISGNLCLLLLGRNLGGATVLVHVDSQVLHLAAKPGVLCLACGVKVGFAVVCRVEAALTLTLDLLLVIRHWKKTDVDVARVDMRVCVAQLLAGACRFFFL